MTQANTTDIVLVRNRDAQAAIRGFVYQVDLTLMRWLNLDDLDMLLPERGEDIDIIGKWMNGGDEQLLEQVKNVTLNTPAVRGALAGFHEHSVANPGRKLLFRFSTNARAVRERTSHFDDKIAGIEAWNEVRTSPPPAPTTRLIGIRKTFADAVNPDELAIETWNAFTGFIASAEADGLEKFIRSVEFACSLDEDTDTKPLIVGLLVSAGFCGNPDEAEAAHLALFHHVMRLLCGAPPRELHRADVARVIAAAYPASPRVDLALRLLGERLAAVELEVREHRDARTSAPSLRAPTASSHRFMRRCSVRTGRRGKICMTGRCCVTPR